MSTTPKSWFCVVTPPVIITCQILLLGDSCVIVTLAFPTTSLAPLSKGSST